jgi:hypothetical protein
MFRVNRHTPNYRTAEYTDRNKQSKINKKKENKYTKRNTKQAKRKQYFRKINIKNWGIKPEQRKQR